MNKKYNYPEIRLTNDITVVAKSTDNEIEARMNLICTTEYVGDRVRTEQILCIKSKWLDILSQLLTWDVEKEGVKA